MAPKGKKGKKQEDDWENEVAEDAGAAQNSTEAEAGAPEEAAEAGGLLAALKKNKEKRKKKGKADNEFVAGEDLAAILNGANGDGDETLAHKEPEEATFEDVVAESKKGKKGKVLEDDDDNDSVASGAVGGGMKSKKEKEKEKKEREKQRKKEQVCCVRSEHG